MLNLLVLNRGSLRLTLMIKVALVQAVAGINLHRNSMIALEKALRLKNLTASSLSTHKIKQVQV